MTVEIPDLDDLTYARLTEDLRNRIPVYSEAWTDHNASDPGITLLELLAWVTETYGYQIDRITDAHRLKYLRLLGERPRPPQPAAVHLRVRLADGQGTVRLPAGTKLVATDETDATHGFETVAETTLTRARVARVVTEGRRGRLDNSAANAAPVMSYLAFGETAAPGNALYLGFAGNPFAAVSTLSLRVALHETDLPEPRTHGEATGAPEPVEFEPSVRLEWQYCINYERWHLDDSWAPLTVKEDGTRQLYRSGTVKLRKPRNWRPEARPLFGEDPADSSYRWIRCVVRTDGYEVPPPVDSVATNVVRAEHRWTVENDLDARRCDRECSECEERDDCTCRRDRGGGGDGHGRRRRRGGDCDCDCGRDCRGEWGCRSGVGAHARDGDGEAIQGALTDDDGRSVSSGRPGQTFIFDREPVLEAVVTVGGDRWCERDDFDASTPRSEHYVLDRAAGKVRFGDGLRGKIPPPGTRIAAPRYVAGGGVDGNVSASAQWALADDDCDVGLRDGFGRYRKGTLGDLVVDVTPTGPATGGADAESIDAAFDRLADDRRVPYRAVSPADYEYVATHTPGLRFGRATAQVVTLDPVEGCESQQAVRVVVVPYGTSDDPTPSPGFLDAVTAHVERHRLLTDRVSVRGPTYVGVGVNATVRIAPDHSANGRTDAVRAALDAFLDPLDGFEGDGWPFGRPLYRSELYEEIESVPGVECVVDLGVRARNHRRIDADGTVHIDDTALLSPDEHDVTVEFGARDATLGRGT